MTNTIERARPTREQTMMRIAEVLSERSTCNRLQVGCVVTDSEMQQVWIGYNGQGAKLPNRCRSLEPGECGCVHAEINAVIKAPGLVAAKRLFTTVAPCNDCASAILNGGIFIVYFKRLYRSTDGLRTLVAGGVRVVQLLDSGDEVDYSTPAMLDALDLARR